MKAEFIPELLERLRDRTYRLDECSGWPVPRAVPGRRRSWPYCWPACGKRGRRNYSVTGLGVLPTVTTPASWSSTGRKYGKVRESPIASTSGSLAGTGRKYGEVEELLWPRCRLGQADIMGKLGHAT